MNPEQQNIKFVRMTRFLCHELLYEYVGGALDPRREKDIEDFLPTCRDSQRELERLRRALSYTDRAAEARVTQALHQALLSFEPAWQKQLREWSLWSSRRGWRMMPYVFAMVTLTLGLAVWQPWQRADLYEVTLARQETPEIADLPAEGVVPPPTAEPSPLLSPVIASQPTPTIMPNFVPTTAPPTEALAPEPQPSPPVSKGDLLRGELSIPDFANSWPAIRDKIVELGGQATGSAKLGSAREPGQAYFHFSLPESNYVEFGMFLGTFGPVRFATEKVSRVMPDGQIRIILILKDADINEATPETP